MTSQTAIYSSCQDIIRDDYTWRRFTNCWTGKPDYALYFPETPVHEDMVLPSMYVTSVAINHEDESVTWHKIRFYGELADHANEAMKKRSMVARLSAEGHVRTRNFIDKEGNEREEQYTVIGSAKRLKVHEIHEHLGSEASDPFAAAMDTPPVDSVPVSQSSAPTSSELDDIPF
ncbi:single-stranded DNA-binding protein [Desulfohalobium retbaense]|uniref:Uncharacterized protein n=1 Tax=Desulfohalobium retbaense (strain ATCC 49708 / DSM 5692 / JCM 16813 / HR100) TaxID=485915 RepID=C8X3A1_DESRD|nr:single-stranded DNA-binding protein [Desulfohalobium retbaense]ACV68898.1 hypothetical protein Dret_1614 [Desulfohalobium retbaense DSM 5692]